MWLKLSSNVTAKIYRYIKWRFKTFNAIVLNHLAQRKTLCLGNGLAAADISASLKRMINDANVLILA